MQFHHVCLIVSDLDRAIGMWTTLFDFEVQVNCVAPEAAVAETPDGGGMDTLMEDIIGQSDPLVKMALLTSPGGARLELLQPLRPAVQRLPDAYHGYDYTGMRELGFRVQDIDAWFEKVKAAGYRLQTSYVWPFGETARSFQFYDDDNHLIQLWEDDGRDGW